MFTYWSTYILYVTLYDKEYKMENKIRDYQKGAIQKGAANRDKVLLWVYKWGWTTEAVLQKLLSVQRRPGAEFCRRGILQKVEPARGQFRVAYVIALPMMKRAGEIYEQSTGGIAIPPPRGSVPFSLLEHNEIAQLIALDKANEECKLKTDRELREGDTEAIPDFAINLYELAEHWHEIELNAKYKERLFFQLQKRDEARKEGVDMFFWHCNTRGIALNLINALEQEALPTMLRQADGKFVQNGQWWDPEELAGCTKIGIIGQEENIWPASN